MFGNRNVVNAVNRLRSDIAGQESALKRVAASYDRVADELNAANEIKEDELAARDRVDISLEEYMNLVNERDMLIAKVGNYESIFEGFNLPADVRIIPCSVKHEYMDDICNLKRRYRLEFEVDLCDIKRRGLM